MAKLIVSCGLQSLFRPWRMGPPALRQLVEAKLRAAARDDAESAALQLETALRIAQQRLGFRADFGREKE